MRERKSYVVIVLICVLLSVGNWVATQVQIGANNHKFCQVISDGASIPVPKPSDPAKNPSREQNYEKYERALALSRSLGCM